MIKKILIANRGEIAVRIIRACREMGIRTVAVYSDVDKDSLHVSLADQSICIGYANPTDSYLNIKNIIEAACLTGADAIHPGFGFLSENAKFAKICEEINIKFIGPSYEILSLMGDKALAKQTMKQNGVPVVEGSTGAVGTLLETINIAKKIGYPIIIKAVNGGGGKGIRIAKNEEELKKGYDLVKKEAITSFNSDAIYIERFVENPRHIEFQIVADEHGNVVHLGERDCTVQRKNQKIIEETPSMFIDKRIRDKIGNVVVNAVKKIGYTNVGTVEFIVDKNKKFYFMEMNTRIQVEHPVTEMVTGIDIVKEQIKIACGEKLQYKQEDIRFDGHSIECRINAENPYKNFMPCPGKINDIHFPGGNNIRIDTQIFGGYTISMFYDSMIAKVIVKDKTRKEAISKMKSVLSEFVIDGIETNKEFLLEILNNERFISNNYDTSFIEKEFNL